MRAVLDPNVIVSALLSRQGVPARVIERWLAAEFELVVSELLLAELERVFAYPRLRERITEAEATGVVSLFRRAAEVATDMDAPPRRSADPGDDYLLALAETENAVLVSGDRHLLELSDRYPILSAREFLDLLERGRFV